MRFTDGQEPSVKEICTLLGIGKTTFYRYLKQTETLGGIPTANGSLEYWWVRYVESKGYTWVIRS